LHPDLGDVGLQLTPFGASALLMLIRGHPQECRAMPASPSAQTALVTGASGGIGRAIAEQFARAGINLVLSARNEATLNEIAADWRARYGALLRSCPPT
jgi:FlaA1/EpsC-like NDP-sugar epimerase